MDFLVCWLGFCSGTDWNVLDSVMQNNVKSYRSRRQHGPNPHGQPQKWRNVWLHRCCIKNHQFLSTSCSCIVGVAELSVGLEWAECSFEAGHWMWMMTEQYFWIDGKKPDVFLYSRVYALTKPIERAFVPLYCLHLCNSSHLSILGLDFPHCYSALPSIHHSKTHTFFSFMFCFCYAFLLDLLAL